MIQKLRLALSALLLTVSVGLSAQSWADFTDTYMKNAGLTSLDGWTHEYDKVGNNPDHKTDGDVPVIEYYHTWGDPGAPIGTTKNFTLKQTVTLPAGDYKLSWHGFYREGDPGTGVNTKTYIFAGENTKYIVGLNSDGVGAYTGSKDLYKAANAFSKGAFLNELEFTVSAEGAVEIGLKGYIDTYRGWAIVGPAKLYKKVEFFTAYSQALAEANAVSALKMSVDAKAALEAAIAEHGSHTAATAAETLTASTDALLAAITAANTSVSFYASGKISLDAYHAILDNTNVYTAATYETLKATVDAWQAAWDGGTLAETIVDPSKATGWHAATIYDDMLISAWTKNGAAVGVENWNSLHVNTWSTEGINDGSNFLVPFLEYWVGDGESLGADSFVASVATGKPSQNYSVEAVVRVRVKNGASAPAVGATFFAGKGAAESACAGKQVGSSPFYLDTITFKGVSTPEGVLNITLDVVADNNINWVAFKNVTYTEFANTEAETKLDSVLALAAAVDTEKLSATVKTMLADSIAAAVVARNSFDQEAIVAAQATIENMLAVCAKVAANYDAAQGMLKLMESTNVYTPEAFAAYKAVYDSWENGTLTADLDNPYTDHEWHAANIFDDFLLSAWKTGGVQAKEFDTNLYINTWSEEVVNAAAGFGQPFFEYWTNDDKKLAANVMTATVNTGKPNQKYVARALLFVRQTTAETGACQGITFKAGDGAEVNVCTGIHDGSRRYYGEFTAFGNSDADGNLTLTFEVKEGTNLSWLGFENVKFEELNISEAQFNLQDVIAKAKEIDQDMLMESVADSLNTLITAGETAIANGVDAEMIAAATALTDYIVVAKESEASNKAIANGVEVNSLSGWATTIAGSFHVNTWSDEADASGVKPPFVENWVAKPGPLTNGSTTYTLNGVKPGTYVVSAFLRVYSEGGSEPTDGLKMSVNDGVAKSVLPEGTQFDYNGMKGVFGTFSALGTVGEDGKLVVKFDVENAVFNWVAYKSFTFTKIDAVAEVENIAALKALSTAQNFALKLDNTKVTLLRGGVMGSTVILEDESGAFEFSGVAPAAIQQGALVSGTLYGGVAVRRGTVAIMANDATAASVVVAGEGTAEPTEMTLAEANKPENNLRYIKVVAPKLGYVDGYAQIADTTGAIDFVDQYMLWPTESDGWTLIFSEEGYEWVAGIYNYAAPDAWAPATFNVLAWEETPFIGKKWNFRNWSAETKAQLAEEASNYSVEDAAAADDKNAITLWRSYEKANGSEPDKGGAAYWYGTALEAGSEVTADSVAIAELAGLEFGPVAAGALAIAIDYPSTSIGTYAGPSYLWFGGKNNSVVIPDVTPGAVVTMEVESHKSSDGRGMALTVNGEKVAPIEGSETPTVLDTVVWVVPAGYTTVDLTFTNNNGCHIYSIKVDEKNAALDTQTYGSIAELKKFNEEMGRNVYLTLDSTMITVAQQARFGGTIIVMEDSTAAIQVEESWGGSFPEALKVQNTVVKGKVYGEVYYDSYNGVVYFNPVEATLDNSVVETIEGAVPEPTVMTFAEADKKENDKRYIKIEDVSVAYDSENFYSVVQGTDSLSFSDDFQVMAYDETTYDMVLSANGYKWMTGIFTWGTDPEWGAVSYFAPLTLEAKENTPDGINSVNANVNVLNGDVYTVNGVKVRKAGQSLKGLKGLYIINGKKVVIK